MWISLKRSFFPRLWLSLKSSFHNKLHHEYTGASTPRKKGVIQVTGTISGGGWLDAFDPFFSRTVRWGRGRGSIFCLWSMAPGFPGGASDKEPARNVGDVRDTGSIHELGWCPKIGNGNPLQYSCLEGSMDRGAWRATVHGAPKSWTRLSDWAHSM